MPPRIGTSTSPRLWIAARGASIPIPLSSAVITSAISPPSILAPRPYATAALGSLKLPDDYVPPTQPPSARLPETRKSQLLRSYTSLLRSTPLILLFQHNNLTNPEWIAVRRELTVKLRQVPQGANDAVNYSDFVHLQVLSTKLFAYALKLTEFYQPALAKKQGEKWTHDLSKTALAAVNEADVAGESVYAQIQPLLIGSTAALTIPSTSPAHLAAALSILAPCKEFPAPTRRKRPAYYDVDVQSGLSKLILMGGRIDGAVVDESGVMDVGGMEGGLDTLRAQLVHVLNSAGMGLTSALETPAKSLWLSLESHRSVLEEEAGGGKKLEGEEKVEGEEKKEG